MTTAESSLRKQKYSVSKTNDPPSVVLAHVNVAPFVQQAARAFYDQGWLGKFLTTVADRPSSVRQRVLTAIASRVRFDLASQFRRRAVTEVPADLVEDRPWSELARLGVGRVDRSGVWTDLAHEWMETRFDRWVSRSCLSSTDIVYGYENACSATFRAAKDRGIFCVYDAPAPEHRYSQAVLAKEMSTDAALDTAYQRHIRKPWREKARDGRRRSEYVRADLIITASSVTWNSFAEYFASLGRPADVEKLVIVAYGAPPVDPDGATGGSGGFGPVRMLWAGSFSVRKGARYLLHAWRRLAPTGAVLDVYGSVTMPPALLAGLPDTIRFHGPVSRDQLFAAYRAADLLVFPTLCDGFGMVVTEALSRGLPVLTTTRAGAADWIRPWENGLLVAPGDNDALAAGLEQAIARRRDLAEMRSAALAAAARWQWSDYRRELARVVFERFSAWRAKR